MKYDNVIVLYVEDGKGVFHDCVLEVTGEGLTIDFGHCYGDHSEYGPKVFIKELRYYWVAYESIYELFVYTECILMKFSFYESQKDEAQMLFLELQEKFGPPIKIKFNEFY
jgi:hypothetical protein